MSYAGRIRALGRKVADGALDRAEKLVDRYARKQPPAPSVGTAEDVVDSTPPVRGAAVLPHEHPMAVGPPSAIGLSMGGEPDKLGGVEYAMEKAEGGAITAPVQDAIGAPAREPQALQWDPFALVEQLGFREKPTAVTYGTLAAITWKVPIVAAIIQTRVNQVASFCQPQRPRYESGFRIRLRDSDANPSPADKKRIRELEEFMVTCGKVKDARSRDSLEAFIRKLVRDTLTYDQVCAEIIPDRRGRPAAWHAVDASTIRLADTRKLYADEDMDRIHTVQIYDNVVISEFTRDEMVFGVRNPRSSIRAHGYGTGEVEMMISTVTHLMWGINYNANFFRQGTPTKGLLNLKGAIPEKQLRAFRRQWYQMMCVTGDTTIKTVEHGETSIAGCLNGAAEKRVTLWTGDKYAEASIFTSGEAKAVCETTAGEQTVRTSADHQFLVEGKIWKKQSELCVGDKVYLDNYKLSEITCVAETAQVAQMYDAHVVDGEHRFVADGFIVHNSGVENAWRTPIVNAEDIQWVGMQTNNRDMEYSAWLDFLIKICCSIFLMDPVEVNFKYGSEGRQKAMIEAAARAKLVESKSRGLKPLLRFFEEMFNKWIIWPIDPNFSFEFTGLEAMTQKELADLRTMEVRTFRMVDELRAQQDMSPLPDGLGQVILDPNWMQARRDHNLQKQAEEAARNLEQLPVANAPEGGGEPSTPSVDSGGDDIDESTPQGQQQKERLLEAREDKRDAGLVPKKPAAAPAPATKAEVTTGEILEKSRRARSVSAEIIV